MILFLIAEAPITQEPPAEGNWKTPDQTVCLHIKNLFILILTMLFLWHAYKHCQLLSTLKDVPIINYLLFSSEERRYVGFSDAVNFDDAVVRCEGEGRTLAEIRCEEELIIFR